MLDRRFAELGFIGWAEHSPDGAHADAGSSGERALQSALQALFAGQAFPTEIAEGDLILRRDALGKPYVRWKGQLAEWALKRGLSDANLHVSNSHDGGAHLVLAGYGEEIVGVGVDAVHLPRFCKIGKDIPYLHRFARHFMGSKEKKIFEEASRGEDLEAVRLRVAAHFSLMEAASKACGTGLKIGAGMGTPASLAKNELGVESLGPTVRLLFGAAAETKLAEIGARKVEAYWAAEEDFLVSAVVLSR